MVAIWLAVVVVCGVLVANGHSGRAAASLPQVTPEELAIVEELERVALDTQEGGFFSVDNGLVNKRGSHVPRLEQVGWDEFRLRVGHAQTWDPEKFHAVEYAYVKLNATVVWFKAFSEATGDHVDERFLLPFVESHQLQAYEYCNLHGLWQSPILSVVSDLHWNLTTAAILNVDRNGAAQECDQKGTISVDLGQGRALFQMEKTEQGEWKTEFQFPAGSWLGLGINATGMVGNDVVICQEYAGSVTCSGLHISKRSQPTEAARSSQVVLESWSVENDKVRAFITQRFAKTDPEAAETPMVFAFGSVNDEETIAYHSLDGRGYFSVKASAGGGGSASAVSRTSTDDKYAQYRSVRMMHGTFMIATYAVVLSLGSLIARYYRHTDWWLGAHRALQLTATMMSLGNYILITYVMSKDDIDLSPGTAIHRYTGIVFVVYVQIQAVMGSAIYYHGEISNTLLGKVHQSTKLSEESRLVVREWALTYGSGNFFQALKGHSAELSAELRGEVSAFLLEAVTSMSISRIVPARLFYHFMFRFPAVRLRWIHRIVGRAYVVAAFAQMISGLYSYGVSDSLLAVMLYVTGILFIFLIFKELEYQLGWPLTTEGKIVKVLDFWQGLKRARKEDFNKNRRERRTSYDMNMTAIEKIANGGRLSLGSSASVAPSSLSRKHSTRTLKRIQIKENALEILEAKIHDDLSNIPKMAPSRSGGRWVLNRATNAYKKEGTPPAQTGEQ